MLVPVLDSRGEFLYYIHPAPARRLMKSNKAVGKFRDGIFYVRMVIPVINLKSVLKNISFSSYHIGVDPGVKYTGLALYSTITVRDRVIQIPLILVTLKHRTDIARKLEKRRSVRNNRRRRKHNKGLRLPRKPADYDSLVEKGVFKPWPYKRYKPAKENTKPQGWLPPSIVARLESTLRRIRLLTRFTDGNPIIHVEDLYFTPEISRELEEYISLYGVEKFVDGKYHSRIKRAYIHWLYNYKCQYCGYDFIKNNWSRKSEIDHVVPRSKGGNNDIDNLVLSCHNCNSEKGDKPLEEWLHTAKSVNKKYIRKMLDKIKHGKKLTVRRYDTMSVIIRRWFISFIREVLYSPEEIDYYKWIKGRMKYADKDGAIVISSPGYYTKESRTSVGLPKDHKYDALRVGVRNNAAVSSIDCADINVIKKPRRNRQFVKMNKYGFPRIKVVERDYRMPYIDWENIGDNIPDFDFDSHKIVTIMKPKQRSARSINGMASGDLVKYRHKKHGSGFGYVNSVRHRGSIVIDDIQNDRRIDAGIASFDYIGVIKYDNGYMSATDKE